MFTDRIEVKDFDKMPQEYKDLLINVMTIQTDSELGGPHLYIERWVLNAPTAEDQRTLARIGMEEIDHHRKFRDLLMDIGVDTSYMIHRRSADRMLEMFRYPLQTWADLAMFGVMIDRIGGFHLGDFMKCSYLPAARIIPEILKEEQFHINYGLQCAKDMVQTEEGKAEVQKSLDWMYPHALDMFGKTGSKKSAAYCEWGIKTRANEESRAGYIAETTPILNELGLTIPDPMKGRKYV